MNLASKIQAFSKLRLSRVLLPFVLGAFVFSLTCLVGCRGLQWSTFFHPDENRVAAFVKDSNANGYLTIRLYPSGWLELVRLRNWFRKKEFRRRDRCQRYVSQDGRVCATRNETLYYIHPRGIEADANERDNHFSIQECRNFNLFLLGLSALFIFLAAMELGFTPWAAVLSGLFLGLSPACLEFAHYCETDIALVMSMSAAIWLSAATLRRESKIFFLFASFACGFAFSCKYTLAPLLALPFPLALLLGRKQPSRKAGWTTCFIIAGFCLLLLGFTAGTPVVYRNPDFFLAKFHHDSARTYAETSQILGPYAGEWWAPFAFRLRKLWEAAVRPSGAIWLSALLSIPLWWRKPYRHFGWFIPVSLGSFFLFDLLAMPWIRSQETLPFVILLAFGAMIPLDCLLRGIRWKRPSGTSREGAVAAQAGGDRWPALPRKAATSLACLLLCGLSIGSFVLNARDGERMSSAFQWRDVRAECQNWLAASVSAETAICFDRYTLPASRDLPCAVMPAKLLDHSYPECLALAPFIESRPVYYLRNTTIHGTRAGHVHPFTGRLLPPYDANVRNFEQSCQRICQWKISRGVIRPVFGQHGVELWRIPPEDEPQEKLDIPFPFPRPILFKWGGETYYAQDKAHLLGPIQALQTVGKRNRIHVGQFDGTEVYAVCLHESGSAPLSVKWDRGLFAPAEALVQPGESFFFALKPGIYKNLSKRDVLPFSRIRMRGDDQSSFCLTSLTTDTAEAASLLRRQGAPARALELLNRNGAWSEADKVEAFLASLASGRAPQEGWADAARRALQRYHEFTRTNSVSGFTVCGTPLSALNDFARIGERMIQLGNGMELDVVLAPGVYDLRLGVTPADLPIATNTPIFNVQNDNFALIGEMDSEAILETTVSITRDTRLRAHSKLPLMKGPLFTATRMDIRWSPARQMASYAAELQKALDNHVASHPAEDL